jgi:hypothetical protein
MDEWDRWRSQHVASEITRVFLFRDAVAPLARRVRFTLNAGSSLCGVAALCGGGFKTSLALAAAAFAGTFLEEGLRRWLFFVGTPAPQMPRSVSGEAL